MTQEKLLNVLDELLDNCEYNYARPHENENLTQVYADRVEAMKIAIDAVQAVPQWIPVSERLPENRNQEVLISLKWGIDIGGYSDGEWHSEWINHYDDGEVLAWMPLPKPYEPQESEE